MDEFEKAINDYTKAINLNSDYANAYSNRGIVYTIKEDFDRAIADFDTVLRLDPKFAIAHYVRAEAWLRLKNGIKPKPI